MTTRPVDWKSQPSMVQMIFGDGTLVKAAVTGLVVGTVLVAIN